MTELLAPWIQVAQRADAFFATAAELCAAQLSCAAGCDDCCLPGQTVLLVEDEHALRVTCGHFLETLEYTVLVDPPTFDTVSPVISASERVTETEGGEYAPIKATRSGR